MQPNASPTRAPMTEEHPTHEPAEILRRLGTASDRRDFDLIADMLAPDLVYRPIDTFAESQERRGRDEYRRWLEGFWDAWSDDSHWNLDTARVYGDAAIALWRFSGRSRVSDVEVSGGVFVVYRFRDGQDRVDGGLHRP